MGNYTSCKLSNPLQIKNSKSTTKVIFPTGEIKQINQPTKAAELMMEKPNFFITNTKTMKIGKRFCPLNADDDLHRGTVYALFPMHRKNSVITGSDLGSLFMTANSAVKRGKVRVRPHDSTFINDDAVAAPRLSLDGMEEVSLPVFRHRMSLSRSRKPLLETIDEEPVRSRSRHWVI